MSNHPMYHEMLRWLRDEFAAAMPQAFGVDHHTLAEVTADYMIDVLLEHFTVEPEVRDIGREKLGEKLLLIQKEWRERG